MLDAQTGEDLSKAVVMQILIEREGGGQLFPVGLLHRMIRFCGHAPWQKALSGQVATGMELLDAQLNQLEQQWGWMRRDSPPPARAPAARPPEHAPDDGPPVVGEAEGPIYGQQAPPAGPAAGPTTEPAADPELDALRQRLAALDARLGGGRDGR